MLYFNELPNIIKMHIYEYDDTYKQKFKSVLKELTNNFDKLRYNKQKNIMIKIIKEQLYNNEYNYAYPKISIDFILKSFKNDILNNHLICKNIKLIYDRNNINNVKEFIDDNKLNKLLFDSINNHKLIEYFLINLIEYRNYKYFDIIQNVIEDENSIYVYKNYDFIKQPHLFNIKAYMYDEFNKWGVDNNDTVINIYKDLLQKAQTFYDKYNGLFIFNDKYNGLFINNKTIQIRYDCNDSRLYYYFI